MFLISAVRIKNVHYAAKRRNGSNKRCHPVQQEKQAKVTLEPEESVGDPRKNRNGLSVRFGLRGDWGFVEQLCHILFSKYEQLARRLTGAPLSIKCVNSED